MEQLDPTIVNLAKSIRQIESGGNYTVPGKSGEYGAYQYMPSTWAHDSAKYLGKPIDLQSATKEQQNEVAYKKLFDLKRAGYNVGQIASIWNSGDPEAYQGTFSTTTNTHKAGDPSFGVNHYGARYNVPQYAKSVASTYQQLKSGVTNPILEPTASTISKESDTTPSETETSAEVPDNGLWGKLKSRWASVGNELKSDFGKNMNPEEFGTMAPVKRGALFGYHVAGQAAGSLNDVANALIRKIPGVAYLEDSLGESVAKSKLGQSIGNEWQKFEENNPEMAQVAGDTFNIAAAIPILKGISAAKNFVQGTVQNHIKSSAEGKLAEHLVHTGVATPENAQSIVKTLVENDALPDPVNGALNTVRAKNVLSNAIAHNTDLLHPDLSIAANAGKYVNPNVFIAEQEGLQSALQAKQLALDALEKLHGAALMPAPSSSLLTKAVTGTARAGAGIVKYPFKHPVASLLGIYALNRKLGGPPWFNESI